MSSQSTLLGAAGEHFVLVPTTSPRIYSRTGTDRCPERRYIDHRHRRPTTRCNSGKIVTTLPDTNQISETDYQYDSFSYTNYNCSSNYVQCARNNSAPAQSYSTSRGNVTDIQQHDWGTGVRGPLLREEVKTYLHDSNPNYLNVNIVNKVLTDTIKDGSGNQVAQAKYEYDNYTGFTSMVPLSGVHQHNDTDYSTSNTLRGNVTRVQRWRNTDGTFLTTAYVYDELGNIQTIQDPNLNNTGYSYSDSFANSACPPPSNSNAYVSQVTNAKGQKIQVVRYPCTGLVQAHKDQNDINASRAGTTYTYDLIGRVTLKSMPNAGQISTTYNDVPPVSSTATTKITASLNTVNTTERDGFGRVTQTQLNSDPEGATYVDTGYDLLGRKASVSNPHRSGSLPTDGTTSYLYDALNRPCLVVPPDGTLPSGSSCPTTNPGSDVLTTYSGSTSIVADQAGKARKIKTDALGRLITVWEDPNGLNYETDYQYTALGDLLSVVQSGSRQRSFTHDSLSQLTMATNPESGQITYTYDNNENVLSKTAPAPNQTSTLTVTTHYSYEALNRLTGKTYSNSDPSISYTYDQAACLGLSACDNVGQRTAMTDAAGSESWSFSIPLRTAIDQRTTDTILKQTTAVSNFDDSPSTLTYPSSRVVGYTMSAAGRPLAAADTSNNYAAAALYAPPGLLGSVTSGTSLSSTFYYNKRLQPCRITARNSGTAPVSCTDATIGNVLDISYNFSLGSGDNGNVTSVTNNRFPNRSESFTYDSLNRLLTAATAATHATDPTDCWSEAYVYDNATGPHAWGNLVQINSVSSAYTGCMQEGMLNQSVNANNQIMGWCYDAAGNLLVEGACGSATYVYNAENELTKAAGVTYTYDGDGKRVSKSNGKIYWYGGGNDPIAETDSSGNNLDEYIFFDGQRIARRDSTGTVDYYVADHLGTARIVTGSSGSVLDQSDFYPYGGERVLTSSSGNAYKFTSKERDTESGLDNFGARYLGSSIGRFMSPDAGASHPETPQSLNRYVYAMDNPLLYLDPDGNDPQQFFANLKKAWAGTQQAFRKSISSYGSAYTSVMKTLTGNRNFSWTNITANDLNAVGMNLTLALIGGEGDMMGAGMAEGAATALDTNILIDIEKGAAAASDFGNNLVTSPTAFGEFLKGTTPEKAAEFLKQNNISVQGVGNTSVYAAVFEDASKAGLSQADADVIATAASNGTKLETRDQKIIDYAISKGIRITPAKPKP